MVDAFAHTAVPVVASRGDETSNFGWRLNLFLVSHPEQSLLASRI